MVADTTYDSIISSTTEYWFVYNPDSAYLAVNVSDTSSNCNTNVTNLYLYIQNGVSISLVDSCVLDSTGFYEYGILEADSTYYLKFIIDNPYKAFKLINSSRADYYYTNIDCPPLPCINLVRNGNFEEIHPYIRTLLANSSPYYDPFYFLSIPWQRSFFNPVCGWKAGYSHPQIRYLNGSPAGFATWWGNSSELFYTDIDLIPNTDYLIEFDYKMSNIDPTPPASEGKIVLCTSQVFNMGNLHNIYVYGTNSSNQLSQTFNTGSNHYQTLCVSSNTAGESITIDNIVIVPVVLTTGPIVTGPTDLCIPIVSGGVNCFQYEITNYATVAEPYTYSLNGGTAVPISSSQFQIPESSFDCIDPNVITVSDKCGNTVDIEVSLCCVNANNCYEYANTYFNSTTLANAGGNTNLLFNGIVHVNENISLYDYMLYFGPDAKIIVDEGYKFDIYNCTLQDDCGCPWDGIYVMDDGALTAELTISEDVTIKNAKNAVVAENNSKITIHDATFINNGIGIMLLDYYPDLCGTSSSNPPPTIPIRDISIHSNVFIYDDNETLYFTECIGIEIDSVYDATIGNGDYPYILNTFDNLNVGIKISESFVKIYNNEFLNISCMNTFARLLTSNNKPRGGVAILADKDLTPIASPLNSSSSLCVEPHIIVGDDNQESNQFTNCTFGIFSYGHEAEVVNNTFTEQKFSAIWVWDAKSHILDNEIDQLTNIWSPNDNLNSAILVENTFSQVLSNNIQLLKIINNKITNTRTAIKVVNCSSPIINSTYNAVKRNTIIFNQLYTDTYANGYANMGVFIVNCDRLEVRSNIINNNSGSRAGIFKELIGIRVDKTAEAWIEDNEENINLGTGIWVNGNCTNTQFTCNIFDNCDKGIYTFTDSWSRNGASISDQGDNTSNYKRAQDNQFLNMPWIDDRRVSGDLVSYSHPKWYHQNIVPNYARIILPPSQHIERSMSNPDIFCNNEARSLYANIEDPDFALYKELLYKDIAMDSIEYNMFNYNFKFSDKEYLYKTLFNNPTMIDQSNADDSIYFAFLNNNQDFETLINIQEAMELGDTNNAFSLNNSLNTDSLVMQNIVKVNDIYLKSFAQNKYFSIEQEEQLYEIASLTESEGGSAVYSARVMLGYNPLSNPFNERSIHITNPNPTQIDSENQVKIYPNPATNNLTIEFTDILEKNTIFVLYDLSGREVAKYSLTEKTNIFNINISKLQSGIYIYNINSDDVTTGKLIIN